MVSSELPKNVSGRIAGLYELSLSRHPQYQSIVGSRVLKAPMFDSAYTGPKLADLDIVGADATINPQQEIQFTGEVLGPINVSEAAIYSFLVNRGGASSPGPIKGQPGISFDAVVQVTTGPQGTSGTVSLLNAQAQPISTTTLPASSVQIAGESVKVTVPLNLLPSSAPSSTRPGIDIESYTFSTELARQLGERRCRVRDRIHDGQDKRIRNTPSLTTWLGTVRCRCSRTLGAIPSADFLPST